MKPLSIPPPSTILIVTYGGIGDILLTTPLISSLKKAYPNAAVHAYVQKNRETILEGNSDIARIHSSRFRHGFRSYFDFFMKFFRKYDLAISTRTSDRQVLFSRWAGRKAISLLTPRERGLFWKKWLLSGWVDSNEKKHVVHDLLTLANVLGIDPCFECRVPIDPHSSQRLEELLPFSWPAQPYAVLHPFPRNRYKQWTSMGWKTVAEFLLQQGLYVVLTGGAFEEEALFLASLMQELPAGVINVSGKSSLADTAELLRCCRIYVGPDTAMTHLAAVVESPTIALFGAKCTASRYMPYYAGLNTARMEQISDKITRNDHVTIVYGECYCDPSSDIPKCERVPDESSLCMKRLRAEIVVRQIEDLFVRSRE